MWISRQKAREIARKALHTNDTPERTAFAFAVGVGVAFCPFLGLHTIIALVLAFALRLNRLAVIAGTFANNPYTLGPIIYGGTFVGSFMTGAGVPDFDLPVRADFHSMAAFWDYLGGFKPLLGPFFLGSATLSVISGGIAYLLALPVVRKIRARHEAHLAARAAEERIAAAETPRAVSGS